MALIDVVKCTIVDGELCRKYPKDNIKLGSQLVVYPSQTAFFVKGGSVCDEFSAGTYTITTANIPILGTVVNIPFGNESPFKAEVWFINLVSKLDLDWGTPRPIQIEDPKYRIIVPVRAYGQYGIKITNARLFLETLIGNMDSFSSSKVDHFFKGKMLSALNSILSKNIIEKKVSVLEINSMLDDLSAECEAKLNAIMSKYGITVVEFSIVSVNFPEDDESVVKLKEAKALAARINVTGKDVYQMERSFDVLEKAAGNTGGNGQFASMGVGIGAGLGIGNTIAGMTRNIVSTNPPAIPSSTGKTYFVFVDGFQMGGQNVIDIANMVTEGKVNADTLVWTTGMPAWTKITEVKELASIVPPPIN